LVKPDEPVSCEVASTRRTQWKVGCVAEVAVDWLACFSLPEQTTLFDQLFTRAPLSEAIPSLVQGLSPNDISEDGESYSAADSVNAACAQSERSIRTYIHKNN
jgi:hypothetical protein